MESALLSKDISKKERKKAIVLLAKARIPKNFPKDKALEYLRLKYQSEIGAEFDSNRLKELEEEMANWFKDPSKNPFHSNLINLAEELYFALGFTTDFAYEEIGEPRLIDVLNRLLEKKFSTIIIVPLDYLDEPSEYTLKIIEDFKQKHGVEIHLAWPYKIGLQADFIATHALSFMKGLYQ